MGRIFLEEKKVKMSASVISRRDLNLSKTNKKGNKTRFESIKKKPRKSFEQRRKMKEEQVKCKEMYKQLIQKKEDKKQELRFNIEANKKRKEANRAKSEIFQVIKKPGQDKKDEEKDLRSLTKRDLLLSSK